MPLSNGDMRPSGETAVASTITRAAPPTARLPRCTRCQSVGSPSRLEYWHMGDTKTRFLNSMRRSLNGENSLLIFFGLSHSGAIWVPFKRCEGGQFNGNIRTNSPPTSRSDGSGASARYVPKVLPPPYDRIPFRNCNATNMLKTSVMLPMAD